MPEIIIVNTSPLFYLHRLGLLEVLNKLYANIIVPEAVKKGLIPALKPVVERLLNLDFRLKPDLVKAILELAGEE